MPDLFIGKREAWASPCPFRPGHPRGIWNAVKAALGQGHDRALAPCMGSMCPLWRWVPDTMVGYCGAGGKPDQDRIDAAVERWKGAEE